VAVLSWAASTHAAEGQKKISFLWWPDPGGGFEEVIADFESENPDIDVEMIKGPTSTDVRESMYITNFLAEESTYDLALMDIIWVPKFAEAGWLLPLNKYFSEEEKKEFLPGDIKGGIYKARLYRIPLQTDAGVLYYRKDILQEKGFMPPPRWWDEFVETAKKLQDPPLLWGFVFQGKQYEGLVCNFLEFLWSFGGDVLNHQGEVVINSPEAKEALQFMYDLIHTYKISPEGLLTYEEEEVRHIFQEGRALFSRNWPYMWKMVQEEGSPVKDKVGIIPLPHKPGMKSAATLGGWGFGISKFTKNEEACIRFIRYITGYEAQKKLHFTSGTVPTRRALFEDEDIIRRSPHYIELYKVLLVAKPRPVHPDYSQISDILRRYIHKVLLKELSVEDALAKSELQIRKVLNK